MWGLPSLLGLRAGPALPCQHPSCQHLPCQHLSGRLLPGRHVSACLGVMLALVATPDEGGVLVPATPMVGRPQAPNCVVSLPWFGHQEGDYAAPHGTITTNNDGGWCSLQFVEVFRQLSIVPAISVVEPPSHGEAAALRLADRLAIAYRPAPGFVGMDHFAVRTDGPVSHTIPIDVTVR